MKWMFTLSCYYGKYFRGRLWVDYFNEDVVFGVGNIYRVVELLFLFMVG